MSLYQMYLIQKRRRGVGHFVEAYERSLKMSDDEMAKRVKDAVIAHDIAQGELMSAKVDGRDQLGNERFQEALQAGYSEAAKLRGIVPWEDNSDVEHQPF